jgi:carbon storage regulator
MGLVVARRIGEAIRVGDDVTVTVVRLGDEAVRLHVEAPKDRLILRTELESAQSKKAG